MLQRWADRFLAWRDAKVRDPAFQRWAAAFPLTRPIARRRARALFDLCAGFVYSQVLAACVQLGLFEMLAEGPRTVAALAPRLNLTPEATQRLLLAAASLDLASRRADGRFGLGDLGAALLGNPSIALMIQHHAMLYHDLADPVALLRGMAGPTRLSAYWPYAGSPGTQHDSGQVAAYTALMSASQAMIAGDILEVCSLGGHRHLMDVGGGEGTFLAAAAAKYPKLQLTLFDLPAVAARAQETFAALGLGGRAQAVGGNFRADPLPQGADTVSLVRVAHDHEDATVAALLEAVARALPPGGTLFLAEPLAG